MHLKIILAIVLGLTLAHPITVDAHSAGQPYLSVNGDYVVTNPFGGVSTAEDMATEVFLVGQPIQFSINTNVLSTPGQVYGWRWNRSDSNIETGTTLMHAYDKPGSYVLSLESKVPADTQYRQVNTVGITVVPKADYVLPTIQIKATQTGSGKVRFDAQVGHDQSAGVQQVAWVFADGSKGTGETVTHHYKDRNDFRIFPSVTVTDSNGIVSHALFQLEQREGHLTAGDAPGLPHTVIDSVIVSSRSNQQWLLLLVPVVGVITFFGARRFMHRKSR